MEAKWLRQLESLIVAAENSGGNGNKGDELNSVFSRFPFSFFEKKIGFWSFKKRKDEMYTY